MNKENMSKRQRLVARAKEVLSGKAAMTMVEIIVLISVILVISTALFLMRNTITGVINDATNTMSDFDTSNTVGDTQDMNAGVKPKD